MTDDAPHPYAAPAEPDPRDHLEGEAYVVATALEETEADLGSAREDLQGDRIGRVASPLAAVFFFLLALGEILALPGPGEPWWAWETRTLLGFIDDWIFPAVASAAFAVWGLRARRTLGNQRERVERLESQVARLEQRSRELAPPDDEAP